MFESSFFRGVKRLHLKSQMNVRVLMKRPRLFVDQHVLIVGIA